MVGGLSVVSNPTLSARKSRIRLVSDERLSNAFNFSLLNRHWGNHLGPPVGDYPALIHRNPEYGFRLNVELQHNTITKTLIETDASK